MPLAAAADEPAKAAVAPPTRIPDVVQTPACLRATRWTLASVPRELRRAVVADAAKRFGVSENAVVLAAPNA